MAPELEKEYEKFLAENPNCDTTEIVEYFYNLGYNQHEADMKEMRRKEDALPKYYGE